MAAVLGLVGLRDEVPEDPAARREAALLLWAARTGRLPGPGALGDQPRSFGRRLPLVVEIVERAAALAARRSAQAHPTG